MVHSQAPSGCWQNSLHCRCRQKVPIFLQTISQEPPSDLQVLGAIHNFLPHGLPQLDCSLDQTSKENLLLQFCEMESYIMYSNQGNNFHHFCHMYWNKSPVSLIFKGKELHKGMEFREKGLMEVILEFVYFSCLKIWLSYVWKSQRLNHFGVIWYSWIKWA